MSIDPNTLPDGTVVETNDGDLHFKDGDGRQADRKCLGDGHPFPWGSRTIVRTYTPDPTPDQEVPRDEWANIAVGSRVRIVEINGDEHTVTPTAYVGTWLYDEDHGYDGAKVARVYLLDAPTPPDQDAEAVEAIAADLDKAWKACRSWDYEVQPAPVFSDLARAALAVVREHEAAR